MARLDDDNFVSVNRNQFPEKQHFATRSELAGVDSDAQGEKLAPEIDLRLVRMGDAFLASYSVNGGQTWTPLAWKKDGFAAMRRRHDRSDSVGLVVRHVQSDRGRLAFDNFAAVAAAHRRQSPIGEGDVHDVRAPAHVRPMRCNRRPRPAAVAAVSLRELMER